MAFRLPMKLGVYLVTKPWTKPGIQNIHNESDLKSLSLDYINSQTTENQLVVYNSWEFIRWRYLECPSKKYDVFVRVSEGRVLSIGVTTRYKNLFALVVHCASSPEVSLPFKFARPLLFLSQEFSPDTIPDFAIQLASARDMPIFVTDWGDKSNLDTAHLTLASSDF